VAACASAGHGGRRRGRRSPVEDDAGGAPANGVEVALASAFLDLLAVAGARVGQQRSSGIAAKDRSAHVAIVGVLLSRRPSGWRRNARRSRSSGRRVGSSDARELVRGDLRARGKVSTANGRGRRHRGARGARRQTDGSQRGSVQIRSATETGRRRWAVVRGFERLAERDDRRTSVGWASRQAVRLFERGRIVLAIARVIWQRLPRSALAAALKRGIVSTGAYGSIALAMGGSRRAGRAGLVSSLTRRHHPHRDGRGGARLASRWRWIDVLVRCRAARETTVGAAAVVATLPQRWTATGHPRPATSTSTPTPTPTPTPSTTSTIAIADVRASTTTTRQLAARATPPASPTPIESVRTGSIRCRRFNSAASALAATCKITRQSPAQSDRAEQAHAWRRPADQSSRSSARRGARTAHDRTAAARVYGSLIDLYPTRADYRRFAGERLERSMPPAARSRSTPTAARRRSARPAHGHRLPRLRAVARATSPARSTPS